MKKPVMFLPQQNHYIPAIAIQQATLKHSSGRLAVATKTAPDQICGEARRVGYTGKTENDLALYRLKIKPGHGQPTTTLPGFYIINGGLFLDYEQWKQAQ
ncbi:MAG TPA: hypothetical protein VL485_00150 [Ktedonobacteraceae bacterium]|nr:hypothetical protein [Ktedonobacteraceae bacterium]